MDSISSTWAAPDFTLQLPAGQHQARLQCQELQEPASKGEWANVITLVTKNLTATTPDQNVCKYGHKYGRQNRLPMFTPKNEESFVGGSMAPHWLDPHPTDGQQWPAVVHPFSSDASCSICLDSRTPIT